MPDDIKNIADTLVQLWNTGKPELARKLYGENATRYDPNLPEQARGLQAVLQYVAEVRTGFPDFKLEISDKILEGNLLVTHWTCTGTHKGEFKGIPATGQTLKIRGMGLSRIEHGKVVEEHVYFDRYSMLEQLGVAPPIGQPVASQAHASQAQASQAKRAAR